MIRPHQTLLFLLVVFGLAVLMAFIWPREGVKITEGWVLNFASVEEIFPSGDSVQTLDVEELLASYEDIDSTAIKDSLRLAEMARRQELLRIQYPDSSVSLARFFRALQAGRAKVLHYGDSQIEGDRISSKIRNSLQVRFGGSGPGYVSLAPLVNSFSVKNERSGNWKRFPVFGNTDTTLYHTRFGMYGVFARFTPIPLLDTVYVQRDTTYTQGDSTLTLRDSVQVVKKILPTDTSKAWVSMSSASISYGRARKYSKIELLFSNPDGPFEMTVIGSDSSRLKKKYSASSRVRSYVQKFAEPITGLRLEFSALTSPDFYGIRLENDYGVVLDNIPMRGSSGTYFGRISYPVMADQMAVRGADLLILQFGGNTVPYMPSKERAEKYGKAFSRQIAYLKKLNPGANIILIGPSDMSVKEKTRYVTYPILPVVRDVLKQAAFENGCAFWDMYEVMGGKNSMIGWVNADPPLAAPDYVHFSPKGASKIAGLFFEALMKDYEEYLNHGEVQ